jgi:hypothetical protein
MKINKMLYIFLRRRQEDDTLFIFGRFPFHEREDKIVGSYIWSKIVQVKQTVQPTWTAGRTLDWTEYDSISTSNDP